MPVSLLNNEALTFPASSGITEEVTSKRLYIETYGCAMNVSDSEIVASVMAEAGFQPYRCCNGGGCYFHKHLRYTR
jgi:hypothetical protein